MFAGILKSGLIALQGTAMRPIASQVGSPILEPATIAVKRFTSEQVTKVTRSSPMRNPLMCASAYITRTRTYAHNAYAHPPAHVTPTRVYTPESKSMVWGNPASEDIHLTTPGINPS